MTFWNGTSWVADPATSPPTPVRPPGPRRRLPFLTIAIGALLLLPALAWGTSTALGDVNLAASGPTVTISGVGTPGKLVVIDGRGFKAHSVYQVFWDSLPRAIRFVWPSASGRFHGHLRIPKAATTGNHVVTFSPVDRTRALRVVQGTLAMAAMVRAPAILHVTVRVRGHKGSSGGSAPTATSAPKVAAPTPTPTSAPVGQKVVQFTASGSQSQFLSLMKDMSVDVIEMQAGTYSRWNLVINVDRTARPLLIRPAAGATVIFDGSGGTGGGGLFEIGSSYAGGNYYASNITFDGSTGIFRVQDYTISATGIVWMQYVHKIAMNHFQVRNITGAAGGMTSHVVYVSTDGIHAPTNLTFNDWDVQLSGQLVSGLQIYHTPAPAQSVTALRWTVSGCHWGFVGRYAVTGVDIEGWTISNCAIAFDSQGPAGIVKNMHATRSGAPTIQSPMVNGGGNAW